MISLIVSSYNKEYFIAFSENVKQTIGLVYEIIKIDNPGIMGICEAYNIGATRAQYSYLCFVHEDITFITNNWGEKIIKDFEVEPNVGLVGIAGSGYKPWVLSGWTFPQSTLTKAIAVNIVQGNSKNNKLKRYEVNKNGENLVQVVTIDGCFMFTNKIIFNGIGFDDKIFKNYHCYDIDFSLKVNESHKVMVTFNILIKHLSEGSFKEDWLDETVKLHKKWAEKLPIRRADISKIDSVILEEGAFYQLVNVTLKVRKKYKYILSVLFSINFIKLVGLKKWLNIIYVSLKLIKIHYNNRKNVLLN